MVISKNCKTAELVDWATKEIRFTGGFRNDYLRQGEALGFELAHSGSGTLGVYRFGNYIGSLGITKTLDLRKDLPDLLNKFEKNLIWSKQQETLFAELKAAAEAQSVIVKHTKEWDINIYNQQGHFLGSTALTKDLVEKLAAVVPVLIKQRIKILGDNGIEKPEAYLAAPVPEDERSLFDGRSKTRLALPLMAAAAMMGCSLPLGQHYHLKSRRGYH